MCKSRREVSGETRSASTLILDSQPLELWGNWFLWPSVMTAPADSHPATPWQPALDVNLTSTTYWWSDLGQSIRPLWASTPSSVNRWCHYHQCYFEYLVNLSQRLHLKISAECQACCRLLMSVSCEYDLYDTKSVPQPEAPRPRAGPTQLSHILVCNSIL